MDVVGGQLSIPVRLCAAILGAKHNGTNSRFSGAKIFLKFGLGNGKFTFLQHY